MNILDENIPRDQAELLRQWGVRCREIAHDLNVQGIQDDAILPLLLRLTQPTFLTRDSDFFHRELVHARYGLAYLTVQPEECAFFIRRFLRHPLFRTKAQRLGKVIRIQPMHIEFWTKNAESFTEVGW